jgi:hypothetical protein
MESFEEVEQAIINVLNSPLILPSWNERKKQLKKQKELIEEQEKLYRSNRNQLQKQFTI